MKKHFLTFASSNLKNSLVRISKQADRLNFFNGTFIYNETNLDDDFKKRFKAQLTLGTKGYGYWCWKPQVILQAMRKMAEGDILLYSDVGSHLRKAGLNRLKEYFTLANKHRVVTFSSDKKLFGQAVEKRFSLLNYQWTKGDLLDYFKVRDNKKITHSETVGAGHILIKKTSWGVEFVKKWLRVIEDDFSLIDDSKSRSPNLEGFIEHRHDQAILSLLCRKHKVFSISAFEYYYPSKRNIWKSDWNKIKDYPIWAKRDLGLKHEIKVRIRKVVKYFLAKFSQLGSDAR